MKIFSVIILKNYSICLICLIHNAFINVKSNHSSCVYIIIIIKIQVLYVTVKINLTNGLCKL